jgi:hypothetical protein
MRILFDQVIKYARFRAGSGQMAVSGQRSAVSGQRSAVGGQRENKKMTTL